VRLDARSLTRNPHDATGGQARDRRETARGAVVAFSARTAFARLDRVQLFDGLVNEAQLFDRRLGEHEGVDVRHFACHPPSRPSRARVTRAGPARLVRALRAQRCSCPNQRSSPHRRSGIARRRGRPAVPPADLASEAAPSAALRARMRTRRGGVRQRPERCSLPERSACNTSPSTTSAPASRHSGRPSRSLWRPRHRPWPDGPARVTRLAVREGVLPHRAAPEVSHHNR